MNEIILNVKGKINFDYKRIVEFASNEGNYNLYLDDIKKSQNKWIFSYLEQPPIKMFWALRFTNFEKQKEIHNKVIMLNNIDYFCFDFLNYSNRIELYNNDTLYNLQSMSFVIAPNIMDYKFTQLFYYMEKKKNSFR